MENNGKSFKCVCVIASVITYSLKIVCGRRVKYVEGITDVCNIQI